MTDRLKELLEHHDKSKRISLKEYYTYMLFAMNEIGIKFMRLCKEEFFTLPVADYNALGHLAFLEGERNHIREIEYVISKINHLLDGS